jgi:flagellar protein FliO/FliZ
MMLSLALVIALIIGLAWLVGRLRGFNRTHSGPLTVLGELAVGPKERVVLVRIGDAQALLGVSTAGVTSLGLLDRKIEVSPPVPGAATFAERLRDAMRRAGAAK